MSAEPKKRSNDKPRRARQVKVNIPHLRTIDLRTRAGRLALEVRNRIANDLGGREVLSTAQLELIDRAAVLSCILNAQEASFLSGEPIDPNAYGTLCNVQNRILGSIGLKRVAKDVTPRFEEVAYEAAA